MSISLEQLAQYAGRNWGGLRNSPIRDLERYQFTVNSMFGHVYIVSVIIDEDMVTSVNLDTGIDLAPWGGLDPFFSKADADPLGTVISAAGYGRYNFKSKTPPFTVGDLGKIVGVAMKCADALHREIKAAQDAVKLTKKRQHEIAPWSDSMLG